jgi:hypothetical protein
VLSVPRRSVMNFLLVAMLLAIWFLMNHHGLLTQAP